MRTFLSLSVIALAVCACPALAEEAGGEMGAQSLASQTMQLQDKDQDSRISQKESVGATVVLFQTVDEDGNGQVSPKEMLNVVSNDAAALKISTTPDQTEAVVAARFQMMDIDGDGSITLPEMLAVNQSIFDSADRNADGYVSKSEMLTMATTRVAEAGR